MKNPQSHRRSSASAKPVQTGTASVPPLPALPADRISDDLRQAIDSIRHEPTSRILTVHQDDCHVFIRVLRLAKVACP